MKHIFFSPDNLITPTKEDTLRSVMDGSFQNDVQETEPLICAVSFQEEEDDIWFLVLDYLKDQA